MSDERLKSPGPLAAAIIRARSRAEGETAGPEQPLPSSELHTGPRIPESPVSAGTTASPDVAQLAEPENAQPVPSFVLGTVREARAGAPDMPAADNEALALRFVLRDLYLSVSIALVRGRRRVAAAIRLTGSWLMAPVAGFGSALGRVDFPMFSRHGRRRLGGGRRRHRHAVPLVGNEGLIEPRRPDDR